MRIAGWADNREIRVESMADVTLLQAICRELARSADFDDSAVEEIVLAATELGSNLARHARGGRIRIGLVGTDQARGIRIESLDHGPGIDDIDGAITDGFSTKDGLGAGLGAVNRLMDSFDVDSSPSGTRIVTARWRRDGGPAETPAPLDIGIASRARHNARYSGDTFVVEHCGTSTLVAIIDGLGHGQPAHRAAHQARQFVESHRQQPLPSIFAGADRACSATRGVVMAAAVIDWHGLEMSHASIGNIETRLVADGEPRNLALQRGILGSRAPTARVTKHRWPPDGTLLMFSDGIPANQWSWDVMRVLGNIPASETANHLLSSLARDEDDATVLVVKGVPR